MKHALTVLSLPNMTKPSEVTASADTSSNSTSPTSPFDPQIPTSHSQSEESSQVSPTQPLLPASSSRQETAPKQVVEKLLKGKEVVGKTLAERSGKLTLLELPVDILRLIVHEVRELHSTNPPSSPLHFRGLV